MKKPLRFAAVLLPTLVAVACSSPITTSTTQPASPDQLATVVALTLQALAPETQSMPASTPTLAAQAPASLLPQTFFYLSKDGAGQLQVFRIRNDGKTVTQLTYEEGGVTGYDVSLADGRVAYVANNQLQLVLPDGSNSRLLVDGGPRERNPWINSPVFSPDGKTLAYGQNGLNLYDLTTGTSRSVIADQLSDPTPEGFRFPIEIYWPERYSPDGTKLLVALGHWEVAPSHAVYDFRRSELVRITGVDTYGYCCSFHGGPAWAPDSSS